MISGPLSLDNLAVGFTLAPITSTSPPRSSAEPVSVTLSLAGLELGDRLGTGTGERGELLGRLALIAAGIAVAGGILWHPR